MPACWPGWLARCNTYLTCFVSPAQLNWTTSGQVLVMVIIGGAGTLVGPVLGAALVLLLQKPGQLAPTAGR